jgi:hypothetical protein
VSDQFFQMTDDVPALLPWQIHSATSLQAAKSMKNQAENLREIVFTAIANEPLGLTDLELEEATGIKGSTVRPRRVELQRAGRIFSMGTRPTPSGRRATIWVAKIRE